MNHGAFNNGLLSRLDPETIQRLELRRVDLPITRQIERPDSPIEHLFFLEEGVAARTTQLEDGFAVDTALAAREAILGTSALIGIGHSNSRVQMRVPGYGYATPVKVATSEFVRCESFQKLILRQVYFQLVQAEQSAICNARHSIQQRLCRWFLLYADRSAGRVLPFSHDAMAATIGAKRTSVTTAAIQLQHLGLIQYSRGRVHVLDIKGLEERSCECYGVVRAHLAAIYDRGNSSNTK